MLKYHLVRYILVLSLAAPMACSSQDARPPAPVDPLPSQAQLEWHRMEMNVFVHFSINTFTNKEWGYGDESPQLFNPWQFDAEQWVKLFKEVGFRGLILTTKHHDGFCLWPSRYTKHSVKSSPFRQGRGDVVKEVADACRKYGLKFGIYVSPWDRNRADYGTPAYIQYYRNQLKELFTNYSPIFEMWFDGANGGDGYYDGANEVRRIDGSTYYDWPTTLSQVRQFNPDVIFFSDAGPGVRWVGNERGVAGDPNWNMITPDTLYAGKAGIENLLNHGNPQGTHWIPAEVDVSIRKGWFYHPEEDSVVKSPEKLFDIYLTSVGRGSTLLLNVPPDRRGLIHEEDVRSLLGFRHLLDSVFRENLALSAIITASNKRHDQLYGPDHLNDDDSETYWATEDDVATGTITLSWPAKKKLNYLVVQEYIRLGQRVKSFEVDALINGQWQELSQGYTIGYKRIIPLGGVTSGSLRIHFKDSRACPVISNVEVY